MPLFNLYPKCIGFLYIGVIIQEIKKVTEWHHFEVAIDITFDIAVVLVLIRSNFHNTVSPVASAPYLPYTPVGVLPRTVELLHLLQQQSSCEEGGRSGVPVKVGAP